MAEITKCAHPSCRCAVQNGSNYCSTYCEGEAETSDILCSCGHSICDGEGMPEKPAL